MNDSVFAGYEQPEDEELGTKTPPLTAKSYSYTEPDPPVLASSVSLARFPVDPGHAELMQNFGPNNPELSKFGLDPTDSPSEGTSHGASEMSVRLHDGPTIADDGPARSSRQPDSRARTEDVSSIRHEQALDAKSLEVKAAAAMRESEGGFASPEQHIRDLTARSRVDSAQELHLEAARSVGRRSSPARNTLSKLNTAGPILQPGATDRSLFWSTDARQGANIGSHGSNSLPAVHSGPTQREAGTVSPKTNRLPSIRDLDQLAEAATQHDQIAPFSHHRRSIGSVSSSSSYYPTPRGLHSSSGSAGSYPFSAPHFSSLSRPTSGHSPASITSDFQYGSPTYTSASAFHDVRSPASTTARHSSVPSSSHPSISSSIESHGVSSSTADSTSTQQTTPSDMTYTDSTPRPTLPPPPGVSQPLHKCDWPGCTAPLFQTQYLLNSHRIVHSQTRSYYCSVPDCKRNQTGRGFKRKNEMIRHGLVHQSPGYVCPFCADRMHRYPRPDNLLRHVNAHHANEDRDDPLLAEVLSRRTEGTGKTRRRRAASGSGPVVAEGDNRGSKGVAQVTR